MFVNRCVSVYVCMYVCVYVCIVYISLHETLEC